ncbi:MAG: ankyrin repeat domain-containing protein, partial [Candidatus Aminicenantes bacterium]|nr:ankyrin repeat domain-containing protein [Candidatus Aminicenantes bacterium]
NKVVPLHSLAVRNSTAAIEILLANEADINAKDYSSHTALHQAAMNDATDAANLLINKGADIDIRDDYKRTPLILCARERGGPKTVLVFLKAGADVNARDKFNDTALNLASWKGKKEVVDILMDFGANIPSKGRDVHYLFSEAASHDLDRLFDALTKAGGDPSFKLSNGGTLLHSASMGGSAKIIDILLAKGLNINQKDNYGWTPLLYAARDGRVEAAKKLIAKGADINARSIMGQSPLNAADEMNQDKVHALLIEKGAVEKAIQFPVLEGNYMGQKPPGETPEIFALGIVSSIWGLHSTVSFSPDNNIAMWSPMIQIPGELYSRGGILMSERKNSLWTAPRFVPFARDGDGDVPFFAPDGKRVYFMSSQELPGVPQSQKERIWYVDRTTEGWAAPRVVDASVNDYPHHWQFSADANHTLFFSSSVPEGYGDGDIYFSKLENGKWQKPVNLDPPVNTDAGEGMPFIAPDSSYLLFSRNYDLYISYPNEDETWTEPINLGKSINSPSIDICPIVTPDGKFLFFLSQRGGESHIWWVDTGFIQKLKQ